MRENEADRRTLSDIQSFVAWCRERGAQKVCIADIMVEFPKELKDSQPVSKKRPARPNTENPEAAHLMADRAKKKAIQRLKDEQMTKHWSSYPSRGGQNAST